MSPYNNNNHESEDAEDCKIKNVKDNDPPIFTISNKYLDLSIGASTLTFFFIIIILIYGKFNCIVEPRDVQTAMQVSAGLAALSLAINPFLKDFKVQKTLFISFLIIAFVFLISTCLGFVSMLIQNGDINVSITFVSFFIIAFISIGHSSFSFGNFFIRKNEFNQNVIQIYKKFRDFFNIEKDFKNMKIFLVSPTRPVDFFFVFLIALSSIIFFSNNYVAAFLTVFSYGLFLLISIFIAVLISIYNSNKKPSENELESEFFFSLKKCIEKVLEDQKRALSINELLFYLQKLCRFDYNDINQTIVRNTVREMDTAWKDCEPKASYSHDEVSPRWNKSFEELALNASPVVLVFRNKDKFDKFKNTISSQEIGNYHNLNELKIYELISKNSGISKDVIKQSMFISRFLSRLKIFKNSNNKYFVFFIEIELLKKHKHDILVNKTDDIVFSNVSLDNEDNELILDTLKKYIHS